MTSRELQGLHRSGVGWNNELEDLASNKNRASRSSARTKPSAKRPRASTTRDAANDPTVAEANQDGDLTQAQKDRKDQNEAKRRRLQVQKEERPRIAQEMKEEADRLRLEEQKKKQLEDRLRLEQQEKEEEERLRLERLEQEKKAEEDRLRLEEEKKQEAERLRLKQQEREEEARRQQQQQQQQDEDEGEEEEVTRPQKRKGKAKEKQLDMGAKKKSTTLPVREVPCRYCFNQMIFSLGKVCHHQEKTTNRDKQSCHECNSLKKKCTPIKGDEFVKLAAKIHKISQKVNAQHESNRKAEAKGGDKVPIKRPGDWEELKQEAINFLNKDKITNSELSKDIKELKKMMKHQTTLLVKERAKNKAMRGQIRELTNQGGVSDDSSEHEFSESDSDEESVAGEDPVAE